MIDKLSARTKFPLIVTAYTTTSHLGDYYKRCVTRLIRSCIKFDLSHLVLPLEKQDGWDAGCATKIVVLQQLLTKLNRPLLWLDADAEIFQYPSIFENIDCDFALASVCGHWLTGTLYFTPQASSFIELWKQRTGPVVDEVALLQLYRSTLKNRPRMVMLPDSYNITIYKSYDTSNVVIGHHMRPDVAPTRGVEANPIPEL
ncbi:MAG: hypothetical protein M0R50_05970 [Candidatus Cloacimonetes bacterium]|jgi:hypothetical protein|nr:hypothetical protein [Candidatus Cloacimonadota bacterium]